VILGVFLRVILRVNMIDRFVGITAVVTVDDSVKYGIEFVVSG